MRIKVDKMLDWGKNIGLNSQIDRVKFKDGGTKYFLLLGTFKGDPHSAKCQTQNSMLPTPSHVGLKLPKNWNHRRN